jgi:hypothetical protein
MSRFVEFRAYNLRPGTGPEFHALVTEKSLPLLRKWRVDVIAAGPSLHDSDSYLLIRAYDNLEHRRVSQEQFYASPDWRQGPRESIVALIESDTSVVVELTDASIDALRRDLSPHGQS